MKKTVAIVGSGGVGTTTACFLALMQQKGLIPEQLEILLIDQNNYCYGGAINAANVNHRTGLEYFKPNHTSTGIDCVEGGITKDLMCGDIFCTGMQNRFLMSRETASLYGNGDWKAGWKQFQSNARFMKENVYRPAYEYIRQQRSGGDFEGLMLDPEMFSFELEADEIESVENVVGGFGSIGGTVVMARDYALKNSIVEWGCENGDIQRILGSQVTRLEKHANGRYLVTAGHEKIPADIILATAANQIPRLCREFGTGHFRAGMYHLNGMLYIKLPATSNQNLIDKLSNVNFVVQGELGCMFACVLPPTAANDGFAAVYYPSEHGSQVDRCLIGKNGASQAPQVWGDYIAGNAYFGKPFGSKNITEEQRIENILKQLFRFNPFLKGYITPHKFIYAPVFNPSTDENPYGDDRRVRQLLEPVPLSNDGKLIGMTSPKWTTIELSAMTLTQRTLQALGYGDLIPVDSLQGMGPLKLDVEKFSRTVNFRNFNIQHHFELEFVLRQEQPRRILSMKQKPSSNGHERYFQQAKAAGWR